jgi:DNA polymerase-3 subunit delta
MGAILPPVPAPVHLVFGDEYLCAQKAKQVLATLVPTGEETLGLETVDGAAENADVALGAIRKCREALLTRGLFGGRKVVWLRDATFLASNQTSLAAPVKEAVEGLVAAMRKGLPEGHALVVTATAVDRRMAFYRFCDQNGQVYEFAKPEKTHQAAKQARETAEQVLAKAGISLSEAALDLFMGRAGEDTRQIVNEVEKLSVYLGPDRKTATEADVAAVVSPSRELPAWDLADAFGNRDLAQALRVLRQLLFQKTWPGLLLIMLQTRVRELLVYREGLDRGWISAVSRGAAWADLPEEAEKAFEAAFERDPRKLHPYAMGIRAKQAANFTMRELLVCQREVLAAHEKLVSSSTPEGWIMESVLARCLGARRNARPAAAARRSA